MPIFKEVISAIEDYDDLISEFQQSMHQLIAKSEERYMNDPSNKRPQGKIVSCMLPTEKRRKTHGTNYFRKE